MSDSFFGFDADEPSLREGKLEGMESVLMEALEGDDINTFNDETFGAAVDDDWEETHEKLAGVVKESNGIHLGEHIDANPYRQKQNELEESLNQLVIDDEEIEEPPSVSMSEGRPIPGRALPVNLDSLYGPSSPPGLLRTEELVQGRQNIWGSPARDSSLPRQEEDIKNLLHALQTPKHGSVGNRDPSVVVAGKLSASLPNAKTLDEIERSMTGGTVGGQGGPAGKHRTMTVEELEREMRGHAEVPSRRGSTPPMPQPGMPIPAGTPPQRYPIYQHSHAQALPTCGSPVVQGQFGPSGPFGRGLPPGNPVTILQRQSQSPVPGSPVPIPSRPGMRSPSPTQLANLLTSSPLAPQALAALRSMHPDIREQLLAPLAVKANSSNFPGSNAMPGSPVGLQQAPHLRGPPMGPPSQGPLPGGRNSPQSMLQFLANTPVHQRMPYNQVQSDPSHLRHQRGYQHGFTPGSGIRQSLFEPDNFNQNRNRQHYGPPGQYRPRRNWDGPRESPGYREGPGFWDGQGYRDQESQGHRGDGYRGREGGRGRGHPHFQRHYGPGGDGFGDRPREESENKDECAGLMTQKEKDWVIKIQMFQLQTENPYLDDYYYTTWTMNKAARERFEKELSGRKDDSPTLVLPHLSRTETRAYKPVQFEGSLGRLTASSVHNPRQILDIQVSNTQDNLDAKGKEIRRFRQLLFDVEKSYDMLLDVMDIEKKALALPEESRPSLFEERKQKIQQLFQQLHCQSNRDDKFAHIISVRKGIKLAARLLPMLPEVEALTLMCAMMRQLHTVTKKDWQDEVLPPVYNALAQYISRADLETLGLFSEELSNTSENQTNIIVTALQNKFGSSVIWCLVTRGETLYTTLSPVDMDIAHQQTWHQFVNAVAIAVNNVSKDSLAKPYIKFAKAPQHLTRLLDKRTLMLVEDKLQALLVQSHS